MYWCKQKTFVKSIVFGSMLLFGAACRPDNTKPGGTIKYFDLKGYFTSDTARLNKQHQLVVKTVKHNGVGETQKVKIENWGQELDMFLSADINRPAWKDSYTVQTSDGITSYRAKEPDLKVREILIKRDGEKIKWFFIYTFTKNILYQTSEELSYYPDSMYVIKKDQRVRLMGRNRYTITGVIQH